MKHHGVMKDPDEFDEFDVTSDEFDQMLEASEPAALVTGDSLNAITGYFQPGTRALYTMSVHGSSAVVSSAGRMAWWGPGVLHAHSAAVPSRV
jgi:hypothetical protein